MSTARLMKGGWIDRKSILKGPSGRGICRWCSLEVPPRRFTFCSAYCVHEWKLRTQPAYLREQVFLRDRGICAGCFVNTIEALRKLKRSRGHNRQMLMLHWGLKTRIRRWLWEADHIIAVVEGGGECDLDNIQTLCLRCHRKKTRQLRERRRHSRLSERAMAMRDAVPGA